MTTEEIKAAVGRRAADDHVRSGMKLGMGTGSTAVWSIRRVGELLRSGKISDIVAVPTSFQSELECNAQGIPVRSLNDPEIGGAIDLTIDGADEVDRGLRLTKGGGAALLLEKIVAYNSSELVIVIDNAKRVENLGLSFPIPLEVHPSARIAVTRGLEERGLGVQLRMAVRKMGPVVTDNGNILLDVTLGSPADPSELEVEFNLIPGILENGLFTRCSPIVYVAKPDGVVEQVHR
ncbi:MAG TPA: ribose-5-phosphate isomerase RpiA [Spirochaetia bacterium]|nr:ribose-5-phosphate isomerase RpiA [Spirochaetia bacterium]